MIKYVTAPNFDEDVENVIFLAGPIQGAPEWHRKFYDLFKIKYDELEKQYTNLPYSIPDVTIASPKRDSGLEKTLEGYEEQVKWETTYLEEAGKSGVVIFWFVNKENTTYNDDGTERSYGKTSRMEYGEWKTRHDLLGLNVILGLDTEWQTEKYFKTRIKQDGSDIPIVHNMEDLVNETYKVIFNL